MSELAKETKKKPKVGPEGSLEEGGELQEGRAGAQAAAGRKIRLNLLEDEGSPLFHFQNALKERGIKNIELSDLIAEALGTVPQEWWDAKLEELTPLEWKLHAALENPEMRAKLMSLLDAKKS